MPSSIVQTVATGNEQEGAVERIRYSARPIRDALATHDEIESAFDVIEGTAGLHRVQDGIESPRFNQNRLQVGVGILAFRQTSGLAGLQALNDLSDTNGKAAPTLVDGKARRKRIVVQYEIRDGPELSGARCRSDQRIEVSAGTLEIAQFEGCLTGPGEGDLIVRIQAEHACKVIARAPGIAGREQHPPGSQLGGPIVRQTGFEHEQFRQRTVALAMVKQKLDELDADLPLESPLIGPPEPANGGLVVTTDGRPIALVHLQPGQLQIRLGILRLLVTEDQEHLPRGVVVVLRNQCARERQAVGEIGGVFRSRPPQSHQRCFQITPLKRLLPLQVPGACILQPQHVVGGSEAARQKERRDRHTDEDREDHDFAVDKTVAPLTLAIKATPGRQPGATDVARLEASDRRT
jgi:hypothetical protein